MNESTVSAGKNGFQPKLRIALPGCEVIKHADKSMIGMVDASVTYNKHTVWIEYKFICGTTKGVLASEFNQFGEWKAEKVAAASPTQFEKAKSLAHAGHCVYLFWVLDHAALRKRVAYVCMWHPITGLTKVFKNTDEVVMFFAVWMPQTNPLLVFGQKPVVA